MGYICLICSSEHGEPAKNGSENWYWFCPIGDRVGPFCSEVCAADYKQRDPLERIRLTLGDAVADRLHELQYRILEQQEPGVYRMRWGRDPICSFPDRLEKEGSEWDLGRIHGVAPRLDRSSKLSLEEGEPAEYWVEVEWEMA